MAFVAINPRILPDQIHRCCAVYSDVYSKSANAEIQATDAVFPPVPSGQV